LVIDEASAGDNQAAARRLEALADIPLLEVDEQAEALARLLVQNISLPARAAGDALHIALSVVNGMDFLLTWNCSQIANAVLRPTIEATCRAMGYAVPLICTPEELLTR